MKKLIPFVLSLMLSIALTGQSDGQKIIFDVTSTDTNVHKATILMMNVMSESHPNSTLEVIVYGRALPMLMKGQSSVSDEVEAFAENENVIFTACEVSMSLLFNVDSTALLNGVGTIHNAVPDIVEKQNNGWGYIKVSN